MELKISSLTDLWKKTVFYIFAVLYAQLFEIFLPFSFTKIFVLILLLTTSYGILCRKTKIGIWGIGVIILGCIYVLIYYIIIPEVFSYVYSGIIVLSLSYVFQNNLDTIHEKTDHQKISKYILIYCLCNLLLYLLRIDKCFQIGTQYKGPMPHTNMFGAVLFSLYLMIFWNRQKIVFIDKALLIVLAFLTMSRTYIILIIGIGLVDIASFAWKKVKFIYKVLFGIGLLLIFGTSIFNLLTTYIPSMARFRELQFGGNGRQVLQQAYMNTIRRSSFIDMITGIPMTEKYLSGLHIEFNHSFTENSLVGFLLLYGIIGAFSLAYVFVRFIKCRKNHQTVIVVLLSIISMINQDTLLSVQTGVMFFFGLSAFVSHSETKQRNMTIMDCFQIDIMKGFKENASKSLGIR